MDTDDGIADLHMHTTASDGTCSVDDRIEQAHERNLEAIAITDHDSISADIDERMTTHNGLDLIAGVEVRADVLDTKIELLGYYIDPSNDDLAAVLEEVRAYRRERNQRIVDRLHDTTRLTQSYGSIRKEADGILGRPHLAEVLIGAGIVDSVSAAFDEYLGSDGEAFVPMERISASRAIDAIQNADGVVSFAHPGRVRTSDIESIVADLVADGLDAIEVQYPYDEAPSEGYADVTVADVAEIADEYDLLQTGGSDCHGPDSGKFRIGEVRVAENQLNALCKRATDRRPL